MEKPYYIKRTRKTKHILFEVFRRDTGEKIGQRLSTHREYVACLVEEIGPLTKRVMETWFGRVDLIGRGQSRRYVGKPGIVVAYVEEGQNAVNTEGLT